MQVRGRIRGGRSRSGPAAGTCGRKVVFYDHLSLGTPEGAADQDDTAPSLGARTGRSPRRWCRTRHASARRNRSISRTQASTWFKLLLVRVRFKLAILGDALFDKGVSVRPSDTAPLSPLGISGRPIGRLAPLLGCRQGHLVDLAPVVFVAMTSTIIELCFPSFRNRPLIDEG